MTAEKRDVSEPSAPLVRAAGRWWTLPHPSQVPAETIAKFRGMRTSTRRYNHLPDEAPAPAGIASDEQPLTTVDLLRLLVGSVADEMVGSGATEDELATVAREYLLLVEASQAPNRRERRRMQRAAKRARGGVRP